jgi:tRNA U34 2-thiouridine synthase MnmA/TrmU
VVGPEGEGGVPTGHGQPGRDGGARIRVRFTGERPVGVAPGQAVVGYDGDVCLDGAMIVAPR